MCEHAIGGVRDRLVAGRGNIVGFPVGIDEVAAGGGIERGPRIPHRHRQVEQVPRMHGRPWEVDANRGEQFLVPHAGDAVTG